MEKHTIRIKDGKVNIAVEGVKGSACLQATERLEQALLGKVISRQDTPEMYEQAHETETQNR